MRLRNLAILSAALAPFSALAQTPVCAVDTFAQNICPLRAGEFKAVNGGEPAGSGAANYKRPNCDNIPVGDAIYERNVNYLKAAFNKASPKLKAELCKISNTFLIPPNEDGIPWANWGITEAADQVYAGGQKRYIGISTDSLKIVFDAVSANSKPVVAVEDFIMRSLLPEAERDWAAGRPVITDADDNSADIAVLSIVAHEIGHIVFHERIKGFENCYGRPLANTWASGPIGRFKRFGDTSERHLAGRPPHISDVNDDIRNRRRDDTDSAGSNAAKKIHAILTSKKFGGLLASASREEDFVETYKTLALYQAGLGSLVIQYTRGPRNNRDESFDLIRELVKPNTGLKDRAQCIVDLGLLEQPVFEAPPRSEPYRGRRGERFRRQGRE